MGYPNIFEFASIKIIFSLFTQTKTSEESDERKIQFLCQQSYKDLLYKTRKLQSFLYSIVLY